MNPRKFCIADYVWVKSLTVDGKEVDTRGMITGFNSQMVGLKRSTEYHVSTDHGDITGVDESRVRPRERGE